MDWPGSCRTRLNGRGLEAVAGAILTTDTKDQAGDYIAPAAGGEGPVTEPSRAFAKGVGMIHPAWPRC